MLTIYDSAGNDLQANPPEPAVYRATSEGIDVGVNVTLQETDPNLPAPTLTAALYWDTGQQPATLTAVSSSLSINTTKRLRYGKYQVRLIATNNRAPVPDSVTVVWAVEVKPISQITTPSLNLYGPILARDDGYPSAQSWNFDTASGLKVLQSSVKMLFITVIGERLMDLQYGTRLRQLLFSPNTSGLSSLIQQELIRAVATYEPRVRIDDIKITRSPDQRQVQVEVSCSSVLTSEPFPITMDFAS